MTRCFAVLLCLAAIAPVGAADAVSFQNDVSAVLSRAGCNQGACHGNLNGKGGFRLSLRGEDPLFDRAAITRDMLGRRADPLNPDQSLLLRKAAGLVPHEGGPRFAVDSPEYRVVRDWIAAGCPPDRADLPRLVAMEVTPRRGVVTAADPAVRIRATGRFSDGTVRNLTPLVSFDLSSVGVGRVEPDGTVVRLGEGDLTIAVRYLHLQVPVSLAYIPDRREFTWSEPEAVHPIDRRMNPLWRSLRLTPSAVTDDSTFLRRLYLDVLGVLPSSAESREFLADVATDKRSRWIDRVLRRPEFADYWSQKWGDLLRNEEKALDSKGVRVFHQWIRDAIASGMPWNEFARQLVSARGSTYQNPPANLYRSLREPYARAESIAQVFLGVRLQCAKCHNHPFDRWTQNDYHQFAAVFAGIDYRILENNRRDRLDKHEFDGEQVVFADRERQLPHPRTKEPLRSRLLDTRADLAETADPLQALADWIARPDNRLFAKAQVNRVWFHLFGRGLVEPNDDFRASNPAVDEELLEELANEFVRLKFDLRGLVRHIVMSRTYQRSSTPGATNADDETRFSKSLIQPLEAEQLLDAASAVTGSRVSFPGYPTGTRAGQVSALPQDRRGRRGEQSMRFLKTFGKPERLLTCECERSDDTGLLQAFTLLTGELLQTMLSAEDNRIGRHLAGGSSDSAMIEDYYLSAFSRLPSAEELRRLTAYVGKSADRRAAHEDVVWGIVNSKEFQLRR